MRLFFAILVFFLFFSQAYAQSISDSVENRKKQLEAELAALENQIKTQEALLEAQRRESGSLAADIAILTTEINQAKLKIKEKILLINQLSDEIAKKNKTINSLDNKIGKQIDSLAELLRKTNEIDDTTLIHFILSNKTLSDFYKDAESYAFLKKAIQDRLTEIKETKELTEKERAALAEKKDAETNTRMSLEAVKRSVEKKEEEKRILLSISKNKEKTYEQIKKEKEKRAAEIRSTLFALRDTAAIPFGKALEYATLAYKKTGVRPAFVLAVLKQESNMGENVGRCNKESDPPEKKWRAIMKPSRDIEPYLSLTAALGFSPDNLPLSCPQGSGWGGAMGPSQFLPSTWQLLADRIKAALGLSTMPNPWEPKHAIMASATYLADLGAAAGTYTAERNAACRYYSGRACDNKKPPNSFYGDAVMAIATDIQENMIEPLQGI